MQTALTWAGLLAASVVIEAALSAVHMPAAALLGPMIAGIGFALAGLKLRVPSLPFRAAQSIVGCIVAAAITPAILATVLADGPLFAAVIAATLLASAVIGWTLALRGGLPGTTAIWGTSAGAAAAMVLMARHYDADSRLVAFMQYLRVVCVAGTAALVGRLWAGVDATAGPVVWLPPLQPVDLLATVAIAFGGAFLGQRVRLPAGPMLLPMILGATLQGLGLIRIELPPWLLVPSYAVIGWSIGLGFTREVLIHALRVLPQIMLSIIALMASCGLLAWLLVWLLGIDPLTAYLATSPGGVDSIAVIASTTNVDAGFVMAVQTLRLFGVMLVGPALSRLIAERMRIRR